jgi:histidinol-phosphatase (PHP family)
MPPLMDYHVHTDSSFDCKTPMAEMCRQAAKLGITEIAFTDHLNSHMLDIDVGYYNPDRYFAELEMCRSHFPNLVIRAGVEIGEPHRWGHKIMPIIERYPYDVVLGSLHWVGNSNIFDPRYFKSRTPQKAFGDYFTELATMVRNGGFDILAHVDVPKRSGFDVYGHYDICDYEEGIRKIWEACLEKQIIPEINTKGMRCSVEQLHPTTDALTWYVQMGGQTISLGSDAHQRDSVGGDFDLAFQSAQEAGLAYLARFESRKLISAVAI